MRLISSQSAPCTPQGPSPDSRLSQRRKSSALGRVVTEDTFRCSTQLRMIGSASSNSGVTDSGWMTQENPANLPSCSRTT